MAPKVVTGALAGVLMLPAAAGTQPYLGGPVPTGQAQEWSVSATITCQRASLRRLCNSMTGPLITITMDMTIRHDDPTPGFTFTARYTAVGPPLAPGMGLRPYGLVCAFGLLAPRLRFIKGPFDGSTTCRTIARGRMIVRRGVGSRLARTPDFWITSETARVPGAEAPQTLDPLGPRAYPLDTGIPIRWRTGVTVRGTNVALGVLGAPGFPMQAMPLPSGLTASMTVMNLPLAGGSG